MALAGGIGTAKRLTTEAPTCDADAEGAVRYDAQGKDMLVCNSKKWVPVFEHPLGSSERPAGSCKSIYDAGDARPGTSAYVSEERCQRR